MDSFDEFCIREWPRLVGSLDLYCGDLAVAEELAQEALTRAYQRWGRVSAMDSPGGWTHRVAMNLATSTLRRRQAEWRANRRSMSAVSHQPGESEHDEALRALVRDLPARMRAVVVLRYFLDFSPTETGAVLDMRPGAVRTMSHRALARLREALEAGSAAPYGEETRYGGPDWDIAARRGTDPAT